MRHHYIPQGLLRSFCYEGESIWYYNKNRREKGVEARNIGSIFCRRHLNTYPLDSGERDFSLEDYFARSIDDHIPRLTKLLEDYSLSGKAPDLDEQEGRLFVQFFYYHMRRTVDLHDLIANKALSEGILEGILDEYAADYGPIDPEELNSIRSSRERTFSQTRVRSLARQNTYVLEILEGKKFVVARPERSNKTFITSSNPVVRFLNRPGAVLKDDCIELWTTLTPYLAVALTNFSNGNRNIVLNDRSVRKINEALAAQSTAIAGSSTKLILSLSNKM